MLARRRIFGSAYIFHTHPAGSLSAGEPSLLELTQSFLILKALRMYLVFLNEVHSFCSFSQKLTSFFIFHRFFGVPNRHHLKNIFNHESLVLVTCLAGCKRCDPPTAVIFCAADSKKNSASRSAQTRALSHRRPAAGTEARVREACGFCCLRWCVDGRRAAQRRRWGYLYAPRVTLLLRIRSDSCAMVYKPHQQNDVNSLKHDDEQ